MRKSEAAPVPRERTACCRRQMLNKYKRGKCYTRAGPERHESAGVRDGFLEKVMFKLRLWRMSRSLPNDRRKSILDRTVLQRPQEPEFSGFKTESS